MAPAAAPAAAGVGPHRASCPAVAAGQCSAAVTTDCRRDRAIDVSTAAAHHSSRLAVACAIVRGQAGAAAADTAAHAAAAVASPLAADTPCIRCGRISIIPTLVAQETRAKQPPLPQLSEGVHHILLLHHSGLRITAAAAAAPGGAALLPRLGLLAGVHLHAPEPAARAGAGGEGGGRARHLVILVVIVTLITLCTVVILLILLLLSTATAPGAPGACITGHTALILLVHPRISIVHVLVAIRTLPILVEGRRGGGACLGELALDARPRLSHGLAVLVPDGGAELEVLSLHAVLVQCQSPASPRLWHPWQHHRQAAWSHAHHARGDAHPHARRTHAGLHAVHHHAALHGHAQLHLHACAGGHVACACHGLRGRA
mmetsp:Transcript_22589/g.57415  ORF Transcript_22589/g.57415 Transcript_22589/m.57415 type:complete len:374 (+) Transcript_22589:2421-3542(+)